MPRIVLMVLALFVLWRLLSAIGRRLSNDAHGADSYSRFSPRARRRRRDAAGTDADRAAPEALVQCASCATFVPRGRALPAVGGELACSERCRRALDPGRR